MMYYPASELPNGETLHLYRAFNPRNKSIKPYLYFKRILNFNKDIPVITTRNGAATDR